MNTETISIIPVLDAEQVERIYQCLNEEGQQSLEELLNEQDLEMFEGHVIKTPLRYNTISEGQAKASVMFADSHIEEWRVDFRDDGELWMTDLNGEVYDSLQDLRPSEDCPDALKIIDIELMFPHHIIGF